MENDIQKLQCQFERIKSKGLVKSQRKGCTGIGYTFESMLNKKEDQDPKPDFGCVEIKCKVPLGKRGITLFTCSPKRNGNFASRYLFDKYSYYHDPASKDYKHFSRKIYASHSATHDGYSFKLKFDYLNKRIRMASYYNEKFVENVCFWNFFDLKERLLEKLSYLAIVYGYPHKINNDLYYRYTEMNIYKLKGFNEFLNLLRNDKIMLKFYMRDSVSSLGNPRLDTHGVAFIINDKDIPELFEKIS